MSDDNKLTATRHYHGLKTFEDVIEQHANDGHLIIAIVFVAPDGTMSIELDEKAQEVIPDMIERLQAVSRALAH